MKYIIMEFVGTFSLVYLRSLINICTEKYDSSLLSSGIMTGLTLTVFCFFTHGLSNGYFNPYFAMSDMFFKIIKVKEAIGI